MKKKERKKAKESKCRQVCPPSLDFRYLSVSKESQTFFSSSIISVIYVGNVVFFFLLDKQKNIHARLQRIACCEWKINKRSKDVLKRKE